MDASTDMGHTAIDARLEVIGGLRLFNSRGERVPISNKKARCILAYLALDGGGSVTRERIADLLWSESDPIKAKQSLRQSVSKVRKLLLESGISSFMLDRDELSIVGDPIGIDIESIEREIEAGRIPEALIAGEVRAENLLDGLDAQDQIFDAWLQQFREKWRTRLTNALQTELAASDPEHVKNAATSLVNIDPTHEWAHRSLMEYHADRNNDPLAQRQYQTLWDNLDALDAEPDEKTQELIYRIKSGTYERRSTDEVVAAKPVARSKPVEAVPVRLPFLIVKSFASSSGHDEARSFAEGLRQDFIASLIRFRQWLLLDGNHGQANPGYAGVSDENTPTLSFSIEGTLYDLPDKRTLVVTLKDNTRGAYLWSERLDLQAKGWFQALRQLSTTIANSLDMHLSAQAAAQQISSDQIQDDAFLLWLDAYQKFWSWDPKVRGQVEANLRQVMQSSPGFSPAYSGLASIFNTEQMIFPGTLTSTPRLQEAASIALQGMVLDPLDARNVIAVAWSSAMNGRYDEAAQHFSKVRELNPNNTMTMVSCANGLAMCGDRDTALEWSNEAVRTLPTMTPVQWAYLASTYFICGELENCVLASERAGRALPTTMGFQTASLVLMNKQDVARERAAEFLAHTRSRWQSESAPTPEAVVEWFLQHCPMREPDDRTRLAEGLHGVLI